MTMKKIFFTKTALLIATSYFEGCTDAFQIGNTRTEITNNHQRQQIERGASSISSTSSSQSSKTAFSLGNVNSIMYSRLTKRHGHRLSTTDLHFIQRDADFGEILAGGQRYEMVELPDSMLDTTIFVGNLCEVRMMGARLVGCRPKMMILEIRITIFFSFLLLV